MTVYKRESWDLIGNHVRKGEDVGMHYDYTMDKNGRLLVHIGDLSLAVEHLFELSKDARKIERILSRKLGERDA